MKSQEIISGILLDEAHPIQLTQLCAFCNADMDFVIEMVEYGLLAPKGKTPSKWIFQSEDLKRLKTAGRLKQDLGVNVSGIGVVLDLLDEIMALKARLKRLEKFED